MFFRWLFNFPILRVLLISVTPHGITRISLVILQTPNMAYYRGYSEYDQWYYWYLQVRILFMRRSNLRQWREVEKYLIQSLRIPDRILLPWEDIKVPTSKTEMKTKMIIIIVIIYCDVCLDRFNCRDYLIKHRVRT